MTLTTRCTASDWLPRVQPPQAAAGPRHGPGCRRGMHRQIQALLGDIDADRDVCWRDHSVPSKCPDPVPRLADSGSS